MMIMMMMVEVMLKKTVFKSKKFQYPPGTYMYISKCFLAYFPSVTDGTLPNLIYSGFLFNYRIR